jgi:hypothetical protein
VLSNACYEHGAALPAGADAAQPGVWHLYAGVGQRCLADGAGGDGRRLCAGELLHINHTLAGGGNADWMKVGTVLVRVVFDTVSHSWRVKVVPVVKVKYSTGLVALSYVESAALVAITEHVDACDAVTVVVVGRVHPVPDTE